MPSATTSLLPWGESTTVRCGDSHPDAAVEQRFVALRQEEGHSSESHGCGREAHWTFLFRCVECGRWYHRECIARHFAASGDDAKAGGAR